MISGRALILSGSMELTRSCMAFSSLCAPSQVSHQHNQRSHSSLRYHSKQATCTLYYTSITVISSLSLPPSLSLFFCRSVWARLEQTSGELDRMIQEQRSRLERCVITSMDNNDYYYGVVCIPLELDLMDLLKHKLLLS